MGTSQNRLFDILPGKAGPGAETWVSSMSSTAAQIECGSTTVNELTGGRGVHVAMEAVGVPPTMIAALQVTRRGGRVVLLGNPAADVTLPAALISQLMRREIDVLGTWNSDFSVFGDDDDWRTVLEAMSSGTLNLKPLITHRVPLSPGHRGFADDARSIGILRQGADSPG